MFLQGRALAIALISHMPHPLEEDRNFSTVGETVKHVTSPHEERPNVSVWETRREIREILVGRVAIPIDGGPPRFDAVPPKRSSRIITPQPQNLVEVHPMPIRNIDVVLESVNRSRFPTGSQVLIPNHLLHIRSGQANDIWVAPFTVERCIADMCFLATGTGRQVLIPINQRDLRGYIPNLT